MSGKTIVENGPPTGAELQIALEMAVARIGRSSLRELLNLIAVSDAREGTNSALGDALQLATGIFLYCKQGGRVIFQDAEAATT